MFWMGQEEGQFGTVRATTKQKANMGNHMAEHHCGMITASHRAGMHKMEKGKGSEQ